MPVVVAPGSEATNTACVLWDNLLNATRIINPETPATNPRINMVDPATWNYFSPPSSPRDIDIDFGSAASIDSLGVSAHNLATTAVSFTIQYSTDGASFTNLYSYSPLTNDDLFVIFPVTSARYWRIVFSYGFFQIGVMFMGRRLVFPHSPTDDYVALHHGRRYTKLFNDSVKGHFLGNRVMASGAETEVDMGFMDRAFTEGPLRGFEAHYNQGGTFFYASCPASIPLDMGYCRALGDDETMDVTFIEADKMSNVSFGLRSYVGV